MKTPSLWLIAAACFIAPASVAHARSAFDGSWDLVFVTQKGACDSSYNFTVNIQELEGRLTQNVYSVPAGPSSAEVFRNYKNDLAAAGFTILFEAKQDETKDLESFFQNMGPGGQLFGYSPDEARYAADVQDRPRNAGLQPGRQQQRYRERERTDPEHDAQIAP